MTYLATLLKLAKFSVTKHTAGLSRVPLNFTQIILFPLLYAMSVIYDLQMDNHWITHFVQIAIRLGLGLQMVNV